MPLTDAQLEEYEEYIALREVYLDTYESVAKRVVQTTADNNSYNRILNSIMSIKRGTDRGQTRGGDIANIMDKIEEDDSVQDTEEAYLSKSKKYFSDVRKALKLSTEPTLRPGEYQTLPPKLQEKYKKIDIPAGKRREGGYQKLVNSPANIIYRRKNQIGNQSGGRRTRNRKNKRKTTRRR